METKCSDEQCPNKTAIHNAETSIYHLTVCVCVCVCDQLIVIILKRIKNAEPLLSDMKAEGVWILRELLFL